MEQENLPEPEPGFVRLSQESREMKCFRAPSHPDSDRPSSSASNLNAASPVGTSTDSVAAAGANKTVHKDNGANGDTDKTAPDDSDGTAPGSTADGSDENGLKPAVSSGSDGTVPKSAGLNGMVPGSGSGRDGSKGAGQVRNGFVVPMGVQREIAFLRDRFSIEMERDGDDVKLVCSLREFFKLFVKLVFFAILFTS